ncbi:F-box/LRR-repeat protein At3g26922-like [Lycium ferocissimum]|uniref:F-box/LRR-repeat protein At3g26922-like n=1 Tax=Lycium ferocissimum TaxID=112874 RepID=UPI0028154034|nr:F-box/LRR-repeat protein At3g26922-like [Lycium ferocissimum]
MEGTDQISKLPEPILDHILSFLYIKEAAKTSTLSKVWNSAWTSLSCLDFGDNYLHKSKNIVDQILANRLNQKIFIKRFRVNLPNYRSKAVDDWIKVLVTCNIKELFLDVGVYTYNKFPEAIFAAKSLNVLSLRGFKLELPSNGVKFYSLRELHLDDSFLDEQLLQALCAICRDLEVLSFKRFHGLISLQVAGTLSKLRKVKLQFCPPKFKNVDIVAPNVKDLYISSFGLDLHVIEITACKSIKHLKLTAVAVSDQWLEELLPNLLSLEVLYLDHCLSLKIVKISSYRLKLLKVYACYNLVAVDLDDAPSLLRFSFDVHHGKKRLLGYFDTLPIFKLKASQLLEAKIKLIPDPEALDTHWYSKLTESLGNFNNSRAITLSCDYDEMIVIPKDMRENLLPPLYGTKCVHIKIMDRMNYSVKDVVDSLLWISPQLDTLSVDQGRRLNSLIKFTYRDVANEDEKPCCASLPWKCWRHELKKVKLQNFTRTELEKLRNYFLTNTDTLDIIEDPPECSSALHF